MIKLSSWLKKLVNYSIFFIFSLLLVYYGINPLFNARTDLVVAFKTSLGTSFVFLVILLARKLTSKKNKLEIDNYRKGYFGNSTNTQIGLIGHSRGGAVSILTAKQNSTVTAVSVWASIAKIDRYTERQKKEWREKGYLEVVNSRTKQIMRLNVSLLDDIEKNKPASLNIEKAVGSLDCKFQIIHGEQDVTVPVKEAKQLYEWSNKSKSELSIIASTGHTFNITHPFKGMNDKFETVLSKTLKFFNNSLCKENNDDKRVS